MEDITLKEARMTLSAMFFIAAAWLIGGFVHGVTSIGGAMVAMPLITFVTGPREAILVACIVGGLAPLALSIIYRRYVLWRETLWLALGCIPGIPAGVAMLTTLSGPALLLAVGGMLIFFVLWQTLSHKVRAALPFHALTTLLVGIVAAFLTACTSLGGPPLAVYATFRGWKKEEALATLSMTFNFINLSVVLSQWKSGLYDSSVASAVSVSLPCIIIGVLASVPVVRRMPQETFRRLLLLMIFTSGVILICRAVL